jgi:NAD(P)-dependent dehydrogenase (short-subunit alcohol dehydrogenase family)
MNLHKKVALVTGGARRVGRAIALSLAGRGMDVMVHYHHSVSEAEETVEHIRGMGVRAEAVRGNLGNPLDIEEMFVVHEAYFGRIDVLVNSASTFQSGDILEITVDDWNYTLAVNLRAPFLCSQRAAHLMLARSASGVIINIADVAGQVPWRQYPVHSVSKAGLIMLTEVLAKSLGPVIRANAIVPGPVLKPDRMPYARWQEIGSGLPLQHPGSADNVAQAVIALAENDFITGAVLNVDGGDALMGSIDL